MSVRFAPSPTGMLHIGNARACVINYLFAQKHNIPFLLRIDDTDLERSTKEYEDAIIEDLAWLGIKHDRFERQSERFDRYQHIIEFLIEQGRLYPCYETPEELDFKRKRQLAKGEPPVYDRASLKLTDEQKKAYESEGRRPHYRFFLNPGYVRWCDLIRGDVSYAMSALSDPVLVRGDGVFLYTLTSVVDDIDFEITHIIRGEDHVTNTAVQIQLFEAITQKPCTIEFAHLSLLMDKDGHPLSKRLGSLSLRTLREMGIEPQTIISYLARLGTSLPVEPIRSEGLDLSIFTKTSPRFNEDDLFLLNQKVLHGLSFDDIKDRLPIDTHELAQKVWSECHTNLKIFNEFDQWMTIVNHIPKCDLNEDDRSFIKIALEHLPTQWNEQTWKEWTSELSQLTQRKGKNLYMPLRRALTGKEHGPEMKTFVLLLGYEKIKERLTFHIEH
jgi:glutamyl-tRNA synthetase